MHRRASLVIGAALLSTALAAPTAHADIFKMFGEAQGGAMTGNGISGDQKDSDFFGKAPHGMYGAEVGAELFFVDACIQHHQYTDGSRIATWTQFGLGMHLELDLGGDDKPAAAPDPTAHSNPNAKPPAKSTDKSGPYAEIAANLYYGLGTGQQVSPPLDNAQISDKALIGEVRLGFGKHLSNLLDIGIGVPVSYGYFIKNGNGATANDLSTHYQGWQIEGLAYLRINLRVL